MTPPKAESTPGVELVFRRESESIGYGLPHRFNGYVFCNCRGWEGSTGGGEKGGYPSTPSLVLPVILACG